MDGGNVAAPRGVGKRVDTYGFYPLNSRFPLFLNLTQTGDRRPLRKGVRQRIFSSVFFATCSQCQIPYCYTYGQLYAGCGITVPHNSLARYNRQGLRKIKGTKRINS